MTFLMSKIKAFFEFFFIITFTVIVHFKNRKIDMIKEIPKKYLLNKYPTLGAMQF